MVEANKKISFRDLSWVLKLAAIGGLAYVIIAILGLIYTSVMVSWQ